VLNIWAIRHYITVAQCCAVSTLSEHVIPLSRLELLCRLALVGRYSYVTLTLMMM
jgi:hypothetical protein